jgi:hypothetical protein
MCPSSPQLQHRVGRFPLRKAPRPKRFVSALALYVGRWPRVPNAGSSRFMPLGPSKFPPATCVVYALLLLMDMTGSRFCQCYCGFVAALLRFCGKGAGRTAACGCVRRCCCSRDHHRLMCGASILLEQREKFFGGHACGCDGLCGCHFLRDGDAGFDLSAQGLEVKWLFEMLCTYVRNPEARLNHV